MYKYYSAIIILYYSYATVSEEVELVRIDEYWEHIFDIKNAAGNEKFRNIKNLIKTCRSIHHGNANVKRSLSDSKNVLTKERTSPSEETLIGLLRCKQNSRNSGGSIKH